MSWNKKQRMEAVLNGELADRPPVTAWQHNTGKEHDANSLAEAMLNFQKSYDWDWMKINPAAVYCYEAFGNVYDYDNYGGKNVPLRISNLIHEAKDLEKVKRYPGDFGAFRRHIEAIRIIRKGLGHSVPMFQTVSTPIAVFLNLCGGQNPGRYRPAPREESILLKYFKENPLEMHRALKAIAETLADYCTAALEAGADGIFYAEYGYARKGYLTIEEWKEFVEPYDYIVFDAIQPKPIILHTCGIYGTPKRFVNYPIKALHWAQSATGNEPLLGSEAWLGKITPMGGVDERIFGTNAAESIYRIARQTVHENRNRAFLLSPDCTVDEKTTKEEYQALINAARDM